MYTSTPQLCLPTLGILISEYVHACIEGSPVAVYV